MLTFFRHYGLTMAVAMTIMYVCMIHMPSSASTIEIDISNFDKLVHFMMYVALSAAACKNFYQQEANFGTLKLYFWGIVFPIAFGGLIELMQAYLTTYRTGDWMDLLADSLGAIAAYAVCSRVYPKKLNRNEN